MSALLATILLGGKGPGYEVYRRATPHAPAVFIDAVPPESLSYTITGLTADSSALYYVDAISGCNVRSTASAVPRLRTVAMDGDNQLVPPAPNAPYALQLTASSGGAVTASWRHDNADADADAAGFQVYVATGATPFDYDSPDFVIDTPTTKTAALGTFANGTTVRCVVRAVTSAADGSVQDTNTTAATTTAAADAPDAPTTITIA